MEGKIAILADPLDNQRAGVHVFTKELILALIAMGKGDQLLLIREKVDSQLPVQQIAVPNIRLPIGFASFRLFFIIPLLLRRHQVDLVFEPAHFGPFNLPKSIKRMTMIHDLTPLLFPQYHRWHSQLLQKLFLGHILRKTDWILTNSKHTQQDIISFFPFAKKKVSPAYLGVSPRFKPTHDEEFLRSINCATPYFLYVGTIEPRKNIPLLLDAFEAFCDHHPEFAIDLVIAGKMGWKTAEISNRFEEFPYPKRLKLLGFVADEDLPALYTHAKALVYPSQYEGFGLPIIEALACGTYVISAHNSSLVEVGEGSALFFATHDGEELRERLLEVAEKPENKTPQRTFIEHASRFSWSNCAKSFWQACTDLIEEKNKLK